MSCRMLLAALSTAFLLCAQTPPPVKVVFVCEHGSAKSVIAAKHLERLAKERGLRIQAVSRGSVPDSEIPSAVRDGLKGDGIDIGAMKPVQVRPEDLRDAARVVSFGPDLSAINERKIGVEDWSATPAVSADYGVARAYIVKRLQALLDEMASTTRP